MSPESAIQIFKKHYPHAKICGYWKNKKEIIINTEVEDATILDQPAQYVVERFGRVYPTNPARHELKPDNYVQLD